MTLAGASQVVILTAATIAALGVIVRAGAVRWLWRTVVAEPVMAAFRREISEVVDERLDARPLTNGKGWQAVQAIAEANGVTLPPDDDHPDDPTDLRADPAP